MKENSGGFRRGGVAGVVLAGLLAAGCSSDQRHEYLAHTDTVTRGAGDAVAANKAIHTVNPWPEHGRNANIPMDGKRGQLAVSRYETNTSIEPKGLNTTGSSGGSN